MNERRRGIAYWMLRKAGSAASNTVRNTAKESLHKTAENLDSAAGEPTLAETEKVLEQGADLIKAPVQVYRTIRHTKDVYDTTVRILHREEDKTDKADHSWQSSFVSPVEKKPEAAYTKAEQSQSVVSAIRMIRSSRADDIVGISTGTAETAAKLKTVRAESRITGTVVRKTTTAGKTALKGTRGAAAGIRTAATTAVKTTETGVRAAATAGKAAATAGKVAATAATGGAGGVVIAAGSTATKPVKEGGRITAGLAKKMILQNREHTNHIDQFFRQRQDAPGESIGKVSILFKAIRSMFSLSAVLLLVPMLLPLIMLPLTLLLVFTIIATPVRYLAFDSSEITELAAYMEEAEINLAELDAELLYTYQEDYMAYMDDIDDLLQEYRHEHYQIVYRGYEGTGRPDNSREVLAVLFGLAATDTGCTLSALIDGEAECFDELLSLMCNIQVQDADAGIDLPDRYEGRVIVTLMDCDDYIAVSGCSEETAEIIHKVYAGMTAAAVGTVPDRTEGLPEDVENYLSGLTHLPDPAGSAIQSALVKRGTPYSQAYRDNGAYYDCSSFVYYSYKAAGISMVYKGANTAAAEAQYCATAGQIIEVEDLQPGDLLFFSYVNNGRYKNISHVEMYLGNGLVIDCTETPGVAVRQFTTDRLVMCGRPY